MVPLHGGDQVEKVNKFLTNQVFIIEREVLYGVEGDWICEDACVKQMDSVVWKQGWYHTM